jgi:DNA replication protein DnaC
VSDPSKVGDVLATMDVSARRTTRDYGAIVQVDPPDPNPDGRVGCPHVPARFEDARIESFDQTTVAQRQIVEAVRRLADGELDSLVLIGGPGCGKSRAMATAANAIAERDWAIALAIHDELALMDPSNRDTFDPFRHRELQVKAQRAERSADRRCPRWLNIGQTIVDLKSDMTAKRHDVEDQLRELRATPGLLVLDDLGRERISEWSAEVLYVLVSHRYDAGLPTGVTSNVRAAALQGAGYGAIVSRLVERGVILDIEAVDYRLRLRGRAIA